MPSSPLELVQRIEEATVRAVRTDYFRSLAERDRVSSGDLVAINNSFLYREGVRTKKAQQYVAVRLTGHPLDVDRVRIVEGLPPLKSALKKISPKGKKLRQINLDAAVSQQLEGFGEVAFVLIGSPDVAAINETPLNDGQFKRLVWDPGADADVKLEASGDGIRVRQISRENEIWSDVVRLTTDAGIEINPSFRDTLSEGLTKIQETATAPLTLPAGEVNNESLTDRIAGALDVQLGHYRAAIANLDSSENAHHALMEVYRLAYAFASDALTYLRLLMSVCDLKPLLLWLTIHAHLKLTAVFDGLPWADAGRKASLTNYRDAIADARNSAFHDALPFRTALKVAFPDGALQAPVLTFFSPFTGKRDSKNTLDFKDKELFDVLLQFTRARERLLPDTFWNRNAEVMQATTDLFRASSVALKSIHAAAKGG